MEDIKHSIIRNIDDNREKLAELASYIFNHPETALEEYKSAEYICDFLKNEGFNVKRGIAGLETAFVASKSSGDGPRLAFIAEYDALENIGHACGHHLISAMSAGAGIALAIALTLFPGEVMVIGTPGEELGEGKPRLIENGVFDGLCAAMMIHPSNETAVMPGSLCLGGLEFRFYGKSAHAGLSPYDGVNALDAVVILYTSINALRQQLREDARIHGIILEAGSAVNCIPDKSKARLEIRAKDLPYFNETVKKVINCAKAAALATGCELQYENYENDCNCIKHDVVLAAGFKSAMAELGELESGETTVSTDMGNVSQIIPAIHPMLKMVDNNARLHTNEFKCASISPYAINRMIVGAKLLALTGLSVLKDKR